MKAMLIHGDRGDVRDLTELDPYEETHPVRSFLILSSSYSRYWIQGFRPFSASHAASPTARTRSSYSCSRSDDETGGARIRHVAAGAIRCRAVRARHKLRVKSP